MKYEILIFITFRCLLCDIIPIQFLQVSGAYGIKVFMGDPPQVKYYTINLALPFNFASNRYYSKQHSLSVQIHERRNIQVEDIVGTVDHLSDTIILLTIKNESIKLHNFNFYDYIERFDIYDSLSFSYKQTDNFSLIQLLYDNGVITERKFGIIETKYKEGILYLGGFDNNITNKKNYTCGINKEMSEWNCRLSKVYLGNKEYDNDEDAILQGNDKRILVPRKFFIFLKENVFSLYEKNNTCRLRNMMRYHFYDCLYNETIYFPNITFQFDTFKLQIDYKWLYEKIEYKNVTYRQFYIEENHINSSQWQFGIPLFRQYPTLFNYDNSSITFYYNDEDNKISNSTIKEIVIINSIVLSLFFLIDLYKLIQYKICYLQ